MDLTPAQRQALDSARDALRLEKTTDPSPDFDRAWRLAYRRIVQAFTDAFTEEGTS